MSINKNKVTKIAAAVALVIGISGCGNDYTDAEYLQQGHEAIQKGDRSTAVIQYKNAVKTNPENAEARLALADIYLAVGDGALASKEMERAAKITSISEQWQLKLVEAKLLEGKHTEADGLLVEKNSTNALYPEVLALRGDVQLALGNYSNAAKAYAEANKLDKKNIRALLGLAKSALVENDISLAFNYLETAITTEPQNWRSWQLKGSVLVFQAKFAEAIIAIDEAIAREGSPAGQINRNNFPAYLDKVKSLIATQSYEDAQSIIDNLLKHFAKHPAPHHFNGLLAYQQKNYQVALESFQTVMSLVPNYQPSLMVMGATQFILGDLEQANKNLTSALGANPNNLLARRLLGATRMKLGDNDDLVALLEPLVAAGNADAKTLAMVGQAAMLEGQTASGLDYLQRAVDASPEDAGIRNILIQAYFQAGDFDTAIDELNNIETSSAKAMIVRAHLAKGNHRAAEKEARQLLAAEPDNADAYVLLGVTQQSRGDKRQAEENYQQAIIKDDKNIVARQLLAAMAIEAKNNNEASNYYSEIIAINPHDEKALVGLASLAAQEGNDDKAIKFLQTAREGNEQAIRARMMLANYFFQQRDLDSVNQLLQEMEDKVSGAKELLLLQGRVAQVSGKTDEALVIVDKLLKMEPKAAPLYFEKANLLMRKGKKTEARLALREAARLSPEFLKAKMALAQLELELGNSRVAMKHATDMQKSADDVAAGYLVAADVYFKQKQYKKAQSAYQQAFERAPLASVAGKLLSAYQKSGETAKAINIVREQLKETDNLGMRLALAISLHTDGQLDAAEKEYLQVLEQNEKTLVALNNLANLYIESDLSKAQTFAERAYQQNAKSAAIIDTLGWIYWLQGDADKAEEHLQQALALTSAEAVPDVAYHYAVVLTKRGAKESAISQLTKALASKAHFAERTAAKALLSELR